MALNLDPVYIVNLLLSLTIVVIGYYAYRLNKNKIPLYIALGFLGFGVTHLVNILNFGDRETILIVIRMVSYFTIIFGLYTNWQEVKTYVTELSSRNSQLEAEMAERKRIDARLRESEQKYRTIFERTVTAMAIIDADMNLLMVNEEFEKLTGYARKEIEGKINVSKFFLPDQMEIVRVYHDSRRKGDGFAPKSYQSQVLDKQGTVKNVLINVAMIPGSNNSLAAILDITDYLRAEETLKLTQYSVDHSSEIVFWVKPDSSFYYVNDSACKMLGYTKEELLSMSIPDIDLDPKYSRENWPSHWQELKDKKAMTFETRYRRKDDSVFPVEISVDYLQYAGREYDFAYVRDTTKRKLAEKAMQEARAEAELYLDLMGHDISNLNQIAMGYLELAVASPTMGEKERALVDKPLEALNKSAKLIDNVRKLQRARSEEKVQSVIDIGMLLERLARQFSSVPGRDVNIDYIPVSGCLVKANDLIEDAFTNIIGNAIKHSTGPMEIHIELKPLRIGDKECYQVSIDDNGPGIPEALKARIFGRMQRGQTRSRGSGLGLHLVKTLIESYGGSVQVEDRVPGDYSKGSRFIVKIPAYKD